MTRPARARRTDSGSISLMILIIVIGALAAFSAYAEYEAQSRTALRASHLATEAARAAAQAIDPALAIPGGDKVIDPADAVAAAEAYLEAAGATGTVTVADDGSTVTVTAELERTSAWSAVIGSRTLTGTATATLLTG